MATPVIPIAEPKGRELGPRASSGAIVTVWLLLTVIWGSTWLFIKIGLADLPPFTFAALRFVIAPLPLLAWLGVRRVRLPRRLSDWGLICTTGFLSISCSYGLVFWGERLIPAGLTAILFTTLPLWGLVFAHLLVRGEPLTAGRAAGVALGLLGVAVIYGGQGGTGERTAPLGIAAILLGAAAAALSNVLVKARGGHLAPAVLTTGQICVGVVPLIVAGGLLEGNPLSVRWTTAAVVSLLFLALVGSALAFSLFYWLIHRIEVTKAQLLVFANTLVAVLLGWLVLDEALGWRSLLGGAVILAGLGVSVSPLAAGRVRETLAEQRKVPAP